MGPFTDIMRISSIIIKSIAPSDQRLILMKFIPILYITQFWITILFKYKPKEAVDISKSGARLIFCLLHEIWSFWILRPVHLHHIFIKVVAMVCSFSGELPKFQALSNLDPACFLWISSCQRWRFGTKVITSLFPWVIDENVYKKDATWCQDTK